MDRNVALCLGLLLALSPAAWCADAIRPTEAAIRPFNGRNLDGLVTWLQDAKHEDLENPLGQWNRLEVICDGRRIEQRVNGVKCNEGFDADPAAGPILIQTELAEVYVRRWELWPLGKAPPTPARWTAGKP